MKIFHRYYSVLCLLGLLFAAPGLAAYLFYLHPNWLGEATTNKGRLLNPPVLLDHSHLTTKWQLMLWSPRVCDQNCSAELDKLARIRLALGRHLYEVETLLLMDTSAPNVSKTLQNILDEQDIHILRISRIERKRLQVLNASHEIFIINPEHYLVLAYPPTVKPEDIFHDLKQLLTR